MFKKEDIGKRVLLNLDPEQDEIAKALGASKVQEAGRILELNEDSVKLLSESIGAVKVKVTPVAYVPGGRREKEIPYSMIKSYEFL